MLIKSAKLVPNVVYAVRWSQGVLKDEHGNGIHANPAVPGDGSSRNQYNFTASAPIGESISPHRTYYTHAVSLSFTSSFTKYL